MPGGPPPEAARRASTRGFFRPAVLAGELALPLGEARQVFVDAEDIAAVAVAALIGDGHAGRTYALTGPRALSFAQAVAAEVDAGAKQEPRRPGDRGACRWVMSPPRSGSRAAPGRHPLPADIVRGLAEQGTTIFLTTQYLEEADKLGPARQVSDDQRRRSGRTE